MIDSHNHIYAEEFDGDRAEAIQRARDIGVSKLLLPNIDIESIPLINKLVEEYPSYIYKMTGLHPCSVDTEFKEQLRFLRKELEKGDSIAIGEIGIDLYWDKTTKDIQIEAFKEQCNWAIELDLPIVIHSRESIDLILDILESNYADKIKGVFHCFTGDLIQATRIIDLGMYMGLGGVLTFKNSDLKNIVGNLPLDRILIETDSPYLAPVPFRGKRNEPAYISEVHSFLSNCLAMDEKSLDEIIESNTKKLFNI